MGTTVNISSLLTEFKSVRISSVADKRSLANHIADLEKAWKLGNTADAKRHATNVQKIAKRYKDRFTVECIKTIELISSGECVPPTPASSPRPVSAFSSRGKSEMTPTRRLANEKNPKTDGMGSGRKTTVHEQQQRGERVTAEASKGSNANLSEGERRIQGIKAIAHQRQSEKNMEEQLRIIRDRMEELAATIRPRPKDVNITRPHIEDNMSLTEAIISQYQEVLELYIREKDRLNDAEKRLKDMFQNVTKQEYEPDAKRDHRKEKPNKPMDLKELVGDFENRFDDYTRLSQHRRQGKEQHDQLQKEKEDLQKRISDAEQRLKDMFRNVTKQEYASGANKDNRNDKQSKSVDLKQLVGDIENRFEDYTRKMADEKVANEAIRMYEMCTGEKYRPSKEPPVDSIALLLKQKLDSLSQRGRQEKEQHDQMQKVKEDLQKRISDAEQRLKDMFRNVTKQEYVSDGRKDNRNEKQSKSVDLVQLVKDIENRFEDYTRKMADEKVTNEAIRMYETCTGEKYKPSNEPAVDSIAQLLKQKLERLSLQLRDAMKTYSTLKTEQDQIHQSDGMVSGRKATVDEQQQSEDMVAGRKPTCEGRQDTDDMVAEKKPTFTGRQKRTQKDTPYDNQPQQLSYKREAWM